MKSTQQFIEDAIAGGWKRTFNTSVLVTYDNSFSDDICRMLLDPLAWQAVAKTREWKNDKVGLDYWYFNRYDGERVKHQTITVQDGGDWWMNMHRFTSYLAEGKTIEEALQSIEYDI